MKTHAEIGAQALTEAIERVTDGGNHKAALADDASELPSLAFLNVARQIALGHHEKWDGSGYPRGLRGDDIPVSARLMALADVYDALTRRRHYKPSYPMQEVERILLEGRGTHFDPDVVDAYFAEREKFLDISNRFADTD